MENLIIQTFKPVNKKVANRLAYGIPEIAEALGVSENFLRGDDSLKKRRFKRRILVFADDLKDYLEGKNQAENGGTSESL